MPLKRESGQYRKRFTPLPPVSEPLLMDSKHARPSAAAANASGVSAGVSTVLLQGSKPLKIVEKSRSTADSNSSQVKANQFVDAYSIEYDDVLDSDIRVSAIVGETLKDKGQFKAYILDDMKRNAAAGAVLMVGSLRQSHEQEIIDSDSKRNGSCFHTFYELDKQLRDDHCRLDPFLMADALSGVDHGTTLARSLADFRSRVLHHPPLHYIDTSKISLLYAQINKFALENPGARYFNFISSNDEVLSKLNIFFTADNGINLPKGIRLRLCKVMQSNNGLNIEQKFHDIVGKGIQDYNWENTAKALAIELAREPHRYLEIVLDKNNEGHQRPKIKKIDLGREYQKYRREVARRIEMNESEVKEVEESNVRVNRFGFARELSKKILTPITAEIQRLKLINCDKAKTKITIFESAYKEINTQINSQYNKTADELRQSVQSVMLRYSRKDLNGRRNPVADVFRFLLGVVLSIPTLFVAWGSQSFRNTFFHAKSQATMNRLVDVPDLISSSKLGK